MKSPTSIQAPIWTGTAATNSSLAARGIESSGRKAWRAPRRRLTVSAERIVTPIPSSVTTARAAKTIFAGESVNWIAAPASRAPRPSPPVGAALPMIAPSSLCRGGDNSTSAAVNALKNRTGFEDDQQRCGRPRGGGDAGECQPYSSEYHGRWKRRAPGAAKGSCGDWARLRGWPSRVAHLRASCPPTDAVSR
jgi:hypothetical protein